jgi:hypothetical protein
LLETICATAIPVLLISLSIRNVGTPGFGFFQWANRSVSPGVIQDDRFGFAGDGRFDQLVLFVNVIIMGSHEGGVAKFFSFCRRAVRFRFKKGVVVWG